MELKIYILNQQDRFFKFVTGICKMIPFCVGFISTAGSKETGLK